MIDFSGLFSQLFSTYWWLVPLLIVAALFKSAWFKGFIGEAMVNMAVRLFLDKNEYHLIKNVTIPIEKAMVFNCFSIGLTAGGDKVFSTASLREAGNGA